MKKPRKNPAEQKAHEVALERETIRRLIQEYGVVEHDEFDAFLGRMIQESKQATRMQRAK